MSKILGKSSEIFKYGQNRLMCILKIYIYIYNLTNKKRMVWSITN